MIDLFESVQRHTLVHGKRPAEALVTELTRLQRKLLKLLGLPVSSQAKPRPNCSTYYSQDLTTAKQRKERTEGRLASL